jgi:hypothetical protein
MMMLWLLLKAGLGTLLFILILWCAQSRHPRAAGMMLTFPALNGIGLLVGEGPALQPMAQAMVPMIVVNGLLCVSYILAQRLLRRFGKQRGCRLAPIVLMGMCLGLWFLMAWYVAPHLQSWLTTSGGIRWFVLGYVLCASPCIGLLWCSAPPSGRAKQSLWQVLQANKERLGVLFGLIVLILLFIRIGAQTWAGRFSAFPLLPLYTLALLHAGEIGAPRRASVLDELGSTVLMGPVVAMLFVWTYVFYLKALRDATQGLTYMGGGVLGLLCGWGLCGTLIWSIVRLAVVMERRRTVSE